MKFLFAALAAASLLCAADVNLGQPLTLKQPVAISALLAKPANMWTNERVIAANLSAYKDFPIKERYKAQIRLDFFNLFKWYNWNTLNTTMAQTSPKLFATIPLADFADSTEGGPPEMELAFRIRF